jgi:hypothetical protein
MKYGPTPRDWTEFVFEGYVNHCADAISLAFASVPRERPCYDILDGLSYAVTLDEDDPVLR